MKLSNKKILLISPQNWGTMFLSKHHYAIELAKKGNTVYFLNPADHWNKTNKKKFEIETVKNIEGLFLINHKLSFPFFLKFKFINLFHFLMKFHIRKIIRKIHSPIDIIWSFEIGNIYPLKFFPESAFKIFHPVDEPLDQGAIDAGQGAQVIFSVTREILEKYKLYNVPRHFINHGVAEYFINDKINISVNNPIRIGLSGNFLRPDIDRKVLLQIISENPEIIFEFWGAYENKQSNISGNNHPNTFSFVNELKEKKNVVLHGPLTAIELARELRKMDGFLICYDVIKDQSKGTNYHKVMEYLGSGKVIVSNNISTYDQYPGLLQMVNERTDNNQLSILFKKIVLNLSFYNGESEQIKRIQFAISNLYQKQIEKIQNILIKH
ncbi:MAG: hypothetical protein ACKVQB_09735 [Bacteroidia bacterium]